MANDNYIVWNLYVPIITIIFLMIMIYFHRHHALRYLYLINIFCYLAAIFSYFVLINHPVGEKFSGQWMIVIPFIWLIGIIAGYVLSVVSFWRFFIEHAQRHIWAKLVIGIARATFVVLCIIGGYFLLQGIISLKSG